MPIRPCAAWPGLLTGTKSGTRRGRMEKMPFHAVTLSGKRRTVWSSPILPDAARRRARWQSAPLARDASERRIEALMAGDCGSNRRVGAGRFDQPVDLRRRFDDDARRISRLLDTRRTCGKWVRLRSCSATDNLTASRGTGAGCWRCPIDGAPVTLHPTGAGRTNTPQP